MTNDGPCASESRTLEIYIREAPECLETMQILIINYQLSALELSCVRASMTLYANKPILTSL